MPVLNIHYREKKIDEKKKDFIENCAKTIVTEAGCADEAVKVFLNQYEKEDARNSKPAVFLDWMDVPEKRTQEVKNRIAIKITDEVSKFTGEPKESVVVLINDYPSKNIVIGGKCK